MKLYFSIELESWTYPNDPRFTILTCNERKKLDNGYVLASINKILDLLDKYSQKVTFFVMGEIFTWYPTAFKEIKNAGHEIAYHSHRHTRITNDKVMREEILASEDFIKEFRPIGFRAPEIYLPKEAIKPLVKAGFLYSSSIYGDYQDIVKFEAKDFFEFPVSTFLYKSNKHRVLKYPRPLTFQMFMTEMPFGSGFLLAILPISIIDRIIEKCFQISKSVIMFAHNWQIIRPKDASFPDFKYKLKNPLYMPYTISIEKKIEHFLKKYTFGKMEELLWAQKNIGIIK